MAESKQSGTLQCESWVGEVPVAPQLAERRGISPHALVNMGCTPPHYRPHTDCRRSSPSSGRTRDQYAAVVGKKVRAIEKKLKRISTIETNAASSGVNDQQAGLLAKKPQLLSSLQDYRALLESFKTITAKVRTAMLLYYCSTVAVAGTGLTVACAVWQLAKEEAEAAEAAEAAAAQAAAAAEAAAAEAAQAAAAAAEAEAAKLVESGVSTTPAEAPAVEEGKSTNDIVREAVLVAENSNEAVYLLNNVASHVHTSAFAEEPLGAAIVAFSKVCCLGVAWRCDIEMALGVGGASLPVPTADCLGSADRRLC